MNGPQARTCGKVFPPGPHTPTLTACHPQHSLCESTTGSFTVTRLGWTRYLGAAGAFTQLEGLVTDPAGRSYSAGFTTGSLDGAAKTGVYDMSHRPAPADEPARLAAPPKGKPTRRLASRLREEGRRGRLSTPAGRR